MWGIIEIESISVEGEGAIGEVEEGMIGLQGIGVDV